MMAHCEGSTTDSNGMTEKRTYASPAIARLGAVGAQTRAGTGDTIDGAPQPPQAFFTDNGS